MTGVQTCALPIYVVRQTDDAGEPLLVLGGGSNVVIADAGFPGTVLQIATRGVHVDSSDSCGGAVVRVAAGESWDDFVQTAIERHWTGIETLSGIPGSVGATPVQNVGAYGQEVSSTIAQVRTWDRQSGRVVTFANADCEFAYRDSVFKRATAGGLGRYVVLDVLFQFRPGALSEPIAYADLAAGLGVGIGDRVPLEAARTAVLDQRRRRGMVLDPDDHDTWSCGSFFTNPILGASAVESLIDAVAARLGGEARPPLFDAPGGGAKTSAAWLIERAGFTKGFGMPGSAALSTKHTLAVTNRGAATAADVLELAQIVRRGVFEAFGVVLEPEPNIVGLPNWPPPLP